MCPFSHVQAIPVKDEVIFLGVIFDKKLDFNSHVCYLKKQCRKALNILRVLGHTDWCADYSALLKLYRTIVRSKLDYGTAVYGSTKNIFVYFKRIGPNTSPGSAHSFGCISHFPSPKPLCGDGGAISKT